MKIEWLDEWEWVEYREWTVGSDDPPKMHRRLVPKACWQSPWWNRDVALPILPRRVATAVRDSLGHCLIAHELLTNPLRGEYFQPDVRDIVDIPGVGLEDLSRVTRVIINRYDPERMTSVLIYGGPLTQ